MGWDFFFKKIGWLYLKDNKKNCLDAYSTLFMIIIVRRHSTPDTLALSNIYENPCRMVKKSYLCNVVGVYS